MPTPGTRTLLILQSKGEALLWLEDLEPAFSILDVSPNRAALERQFSWPERMPKSSAKVDFKVGPALALPPIHGKAWRHWAEGYTTPAGAETPG